MTFSLWMGKEASLRNFLRMHLIAQTDVHLAWWGRGVCVMKPKKRDSLKLRPMGSVGGGQEEWQARVDQPLKDSEWIITDPVGLEEDYMSLLA